MGDESASTGGGGSIFGQFFGHLFDMPWWHKMVLTIAGMIGAVGVGGKITGAVSDDAPPQTAQTAPAPSSPRSGFASDRGAQGDEQAASTPDPSFKGLLIRNAPWMTRVGVGFVAAFILGWLFRAFIKLMMTMTLVVVLLLAGLSYFRVIDIDFSKAEQQYRDASAWVTDQAAKVKDAIAAHIPASMASTLGMFLGFRRK